MHVSSSRGLPSVVLTFPIGLNKPNVKQRSRAAGLRGKKAFYLNVFSMKTLHREAVIVLM